MHSFYICTFHVAFSNVKLSSCKSFHLTQRKKASKYSFQKLTSAKGMHSFQRKINCCRIATITQTLCWKITYNNEKFMRIFEYLLCCKIRSYSTRRSLDSMTTGQAKQMKLCLWHSLQDEHSTLYKNSMHSLDFYAEIAM